MGATGCLSDSFMNVSWFSSAMLSSEQIILTAAFMLPSSILAEILPAKEDEGLAWRACGGGLLLISGELVTLWIISSARFLITEARLCLLPPPRRFGKNVVAEVKKVGPGVEVFR